MTKLDAKHYENNSNIQRAIAGEVMDLFPVQNKDYILDIGCGDGYLTAQLAEIAADGAVVGIDPSREMIMRANEKYPPHKFRNLEFRISKSESTHGVEKYTLMTAFNCLHWSHNLTATFENCYTSLQTGGKFIGVTYPKESVYWQLFRKILSSTRWHKYLSLSPIDSWLTTDDYAQVAKKAGFKISYIKSEECFASYSNSHDLGNYIKGWLPCFLPVEQKELDAFLLEVIEDAESEYKANGLIKIPYTKLTFCFIK